MQVKVAGDTGTGGSALVEPEVDALGREGAFHEVGCVFGELPEGCAFFGGVVEQSRAASGEGDEQVPIGVWVGVEEDHAEFGADDDMVLVVVFGVGPVFIEETGVLGFFGLCILTLGGLVVQGFEVLEAPGRPDCVGAFFFSHGER